MFLSASAEGDTLLFFSPSQKISAKVICLKGTPSVQIEYADEVITTLSCGGLKIRGWPVAAGGSCGRTTRHSVSSLVKVPYGPAAFVQDAFNEVTIELIKEGFQDTAILKMRLYDAGFAFRYVYPGGDSGMLVDAEVNDFRFSDQDSCVWSWADYQTLEKTYYQTSIAKAEHVSLPFTVQKNSGIHVAVAEASVINYTTSTLRQDASVRGLFHWNLVPAADGSAVHVYDNTDSLKTPWRVLLVGKDAAELANNQLVWLLNDPPAVDQDWSWVHPINYCGIWWEMHLGLSGWQFDGGRHGATTVNAKKYIDFAAANGILGVLIEGWNTGWEKWGAKNAFDFITPYPDFDLAEVARYAHSKGVELIGHHETGGDWIHYEEMLDSAFALYASLGIHYVKTGYAGPMQPDGESHHGQMKVEHLQHIVETAAKYKIMIDAHEPVMPSGLSRTWPNLMTFEAVRGMEWNAWSEGNSPSHNCILPFTRALAGPMDYTPGILDVELNYRRSDRIRWNGLDKGESRIHTTVSHQLALPVVFYSPMQMMADLPENYSTHPYTPVLSRIPVSWDETRVLLAEIGEYIVVARRSGRIWYIAGITNEVSRTLKIQLPANVPFESLVLYHDAPESHFMKQPASFLIDSLSASQTDCSIELAPGGGFLLVAKAIP